MTVRRRRERTADTSPPALRRLRLPGDGGGPDDAAVHVFGPTAMPPWLLPRFYGPLADRLAGDDAVSFHPMVEYAGFGRTDRIVDAYRPIVEDAARDGRRLRLAGHSLGGLVCWVLAHEYPDTIAFAELWAAPLRGTSLAQLAFPLAESRFLARGSRWLSRWDRPIDGPVVRAVITPDDTLVRPAMEVCPVEGPTAHNHVVSPRPLTAEYHRPNLHVHRGRVAHTTMPRPGWLQRELAVHDRRLGFVWAQPSPVVTPTRSAVGDGAVAPA